MVTSSAKRYWREEDSKGAQTTIALRAPDEVWLGLGQVQTGIHIYVYSNINPAKCRTRKPQTRHPNN